MGKLTLELNKLKVDSFVTAERKEVKGTVRGNWTGITNCLEDTCPVEECTVGNTCQGDTCGGASCYDTCNITCGNTCYDTCEPTCSNCVIK